MTNNQETSQKTQTHSWANFLIGDFRKDYRVEISHGATTLIGNHLAVFASGALNKWNNETKLWVVNLRDTSVQELQAYFGYSKEHYSLNNYGENQMIKFGGESHQRATNELVWMTIDSFDPLKIESEWIRDENAPYVSGHATAIYQDCLYVFGGRNRGTDKFANNKLWCFDLQQRAWKLCETTGKAPKAREGAKSFVREDNLYIYGGFSRTGKVKVNYSELFELNLKSMKWTTVTQKDPQPGQDSAFFGRFSADLYGNHILVLKNEKDVGWDRLYYFNRHDLGSWSKVDITGLEGIRTIGNSVIYKNVLYAFATKNAERRQLFLAALDLDRLSLPPPRSLEEEQVSFLFMSENESDIAFKIGDKVIPAHKKVLIEKCKFFANLFKSGMMESRLEIIDIDDCEYSTFQEFLRYLYCGLINVNVYQAIKLLFLADKYVQEDLHERCVNLLAHNLTSKNIFDRHDFAREKGIALLRGWCMRFFEHGMNYDYIGQFIEYVEDLESENDPEYETENRHLIEKAVDETLKRISTIVHQGTQEHRNYYEDFLVQNVSMQNIKNLTWGFRDFKEKMTNLAEAVLNFLYKNYELLQEKGVTRDIPWYEPRFNEIGLKIREEKEKKNETLIKDGKMSVESKAESTSDESEKENSDINQRKAIKRMDPTNHSIEEEEEEETGPILKKTKQSSVIVE